MRPAIPLLLLILAACGAPATTPGDVASDARDAADAVFPADAPVPDVAEVPPADLAPESFEDAAPPDPGPDSAADAVPDGGPDSGGDSLSGPDLADAADAADIADAPGPDAALPCSGDGDCPAGRCNPSTSTCVECLDATDCTAPGAVCDAHACVVWACVPGTRTCEGTVLKRCADDGSALVDVVDCDDGDTCTTGDGCDKGGCLPIGTLDCDDEDPCTVDTCDPLAGCLNVAADLACDDGDPCTIDDRCVAGACTAGGAASCDDGNDCTADACATILGCYHAPADGPCDDGDPCTKADRCEAGACTGDPLCDDGDPCTADACASGLCDFAPFLAGGCCAATADCDDGNACTTDACLGKTCTHAAAALPGCCATDADCADADACTTDACEPASSRCRHVPTAGAGCCAPALLAAAFDGGATDGFVLPPPLDGVGWQIAAGPPGAPDGWGLYYGNASRDGFDTGAANAGEAWSPEVAIPLGTAATLSFDTWQDVEPLAGRDVVSVRATWTGTAGPAGRAVWSRPSGFPMKAWQAVSVDVSSLAGRRVRFAFSFDTVDAEKNDGAGVWVRDVRLDSTCKPKPCAIGADCTALGVHAWCEAGACDFGRSLAFLDVWTAPDPVLGALEGPSGVAVSPAGDRLYVTDGPADAVRVLGTDGTALGRFGGSGDADGRLDDPHGVAVGGGRVAVADTGNDRVQVFSTAGTFLLKVGGAGEDPGLMSGPKGVALAADGTIWVADTGNHRLQAFSPGGGLVRTVGGYGKTPGLFYGPACVQALPAGRVLVCDTQNSRLQVLEADGTFVYKLYPTGDLTLLRPFGAIPGDDGLVWTSDSYHHRVAVLGADGRILDTLGAFGTGAGQVDYPLGIARLPDGRLVVADSGNARLVVLGWSKTD